MQENTKQNELVLPPKPRIIYTPLAWSKQCVLIMTQKGEVGWHGIVESEGNNVFRITDILVYPQAVANTTVTTDELEYATWLGSLPEESFSKVRMHGHSHVDMGVTPSPVDDKDRETIVNQMQEGMFYIFMIWNKKLAYSAHIYDAVNMIDWQATDITVEIEGLGEISKWLDGELDKIKERQEKTIWTLVKVSNSLTPVRSTSVYTSSAAGRSVPPSQKYYPDWDL